MKKYYVDYVIKANRTEEHRVFECEAKNAKEACQLCKAHVLEKTGRNAFRPQAAETPEKASEKHVWKSPDWTRR